MMKKWGYVVVALLSGLLLLACSGKNSSPENFTQHAYKILFTSDKQSEVVELFALDAEMTKQEKEKANMMIDMTKNAIRSSGEYKGVKVLAVDYNDDKTEAKVKAQIQYKDGSTEDDDLDLIKTAGGWKINMRKFK